MYEIENKARELASCVANSEEYKNYKTTMEKVKNNDFLMVRINDYRRKNFAIHANGNTNMKQQMDELFSEFRDVFENEDAKRFLDAEMTFCRMLQRIDATVISNVEIDMDFL